MIAAPLVGDIFVGPSECYEGGLLEFGRYGNGGVAMFVRQPGGGRAVGTVNLVDHPLPEGEVWMKGWSENAGVPEEYEKAGIVRLTGRVKRTGFTQAQHAILLVSPTPHPAQTTPPESESC